MYFNFVLVLDDEEWASARSAEEIAKTYRYNVQGDKTLCDRLTLEVFRVVDLKRRQDREPMLKLDPIETYAFLFGRKTTDHVCSRCLMPQPAGGHFCIPVTE